jgi:hypothetical protein
METVRLLTMLAGGAGIIAANVIRYVMISQTNTASEPDQQRGYENVPWTELALFRRHRALFPDSRLRLALWCCLGLGLPMFFIGGFMWWLPS